ncbi:ParB/RepB/Spo0J family partition protein [Sphingomonas sp.]|jgi:hypothetical protein|uniref:ParB/RepB/Spo0J family partition protein n=1 Tax=Sphingomonas sp. TaxID=28214 RepID=UPI002ED9533D
MKLIGEPGPEWQHAFGGAQSAPSGSLHQEELPDFVLIRTNEVDEGDRLRPVDPVWAQALGQIMARDGQDTPVQVCRLPGRNRWTLVVGAHRLAGAMLAGIEYLRAEVVSADRDTRRLREVRENLWRSDLTPIDRAAFIAEAVSIYKQRAGIDPARDGRVVSAAARWQKQVKNEAADATVTMTGVYGFTDQVASELGLSNSTIERGLRLYRGLSPSLVEKLRAARHPVLTNATHLRALAKLDAHAQAKVVELLTVPGASLNYGQPKTVSEAIAHPLGPKPAKAKAGADDKRLAAFIGSFQRMGAAEQKGALEHLVKHLPKGTRIVDGSEPRPQAAFSPQHVKYRDEALAAIDTMRELVDGLLEDEVIKDERASALDRAVVALAVTRLTIAGNGFDLGSQEGDQ